MYDFANILFAGPCNRKCPWCIGKRIPSAVNVNNLDVFPPLGLDAFIELVNKQRIQQIVFTGTTTDPQLYRYEEKLIASLREALHEEAKFSVHTNGVLALKKTEVLNLYDRACISFPSFEHETYSKMMGSHRVPDLKSILQKAKIPVKVSCVIDENNASDIEGFIEECHRIGVTRLVLRKLYGETRDWKLPMHRLEIVGSFRGNPVMDFRGMEVTYWDFDESRCTSINLFPDGTLGTSYLLAETAEFAPAA